MNEENPWKTNSSTVRFENPWMRVVQNDVINPAGGPGEYTVVEFKNRAVAVIPIDEENHTWLVGQFRYAMNSFEWEIPAGGAPLDEAPLACAQRELAEETGLHAVEWDPILDGLQLSNSITNELAYTFVARGLTQHTATPEDTEQLQVRRLPLADAIEMAIDGRIQDGFSVVSLLKLKHLLLRGELRSI